MTVIDEVDEFCLREAVRILRWGAPRWPGQAGYEEAYIKSIASVLEKLIPVSTEDCKLAMQALSNVMLWAALEAEAVQRRTFFEYSGNYREAAFGFAACRGWFQVSLGKLPP